MLEDGFIALAVPAAAAEEEDMEFIAEYDYSTGVSTIDFTDLGSYKLILVNGYLVSAGDNNTCNLLLSTDNGSSFLTTSYVNAEDTFPPTGVTTSFVIYDGSSWDTDDGLILNVSLWNFDGQDADEVVFRHTSNNLFGGERAAASYDAIRLSLAGNNSGGLLHVWGVPR